jgi:hypothetical protein
VIGSIVKQKKGLRVRDGNGDPVADLDTDDPADMEILVNALDKPTVALPYRIKTRPGLIPDSFFQPFYDAITADDMLIVRTLTHPSVSRVVDGGVLAEALLDIFAHARRVGPLLFALCGSEFESDNADGDTALLRENSHLTCMFKVFFTRYGGEYASKVIAKLAQYIDSQGKLQLKNAVQPQHLKDRTAKAVFTVIDALLSTQSLIPLEIRHFAAVLKSVVGVRFNTGSEAFKALSAFFLVRFVIAAVGDKDKCGCALVNSENDGVGPFARLLQMPFTGSVFSGRYGSCIGMNHHLVTVFPKLLNFVQALADLPGEDAPAPVYPVPSDQRLNQALDTVLGCIYNLSPGGTSSNHKKFLARYTELTRLGKDNVPITGWMISTYLMSFFKAVRFDDTRNPDEEEDEAGGETQDKSRGETEAEDKSGTHGESEDKAPE